MSFFLRSPKSTQELLDLIQQTSLGQETLCRFLPFYKQERILIESYPERIRSKLVSVRSADHPIGAVFVTDGTHGTIYIDLKSESGVLLPFLFHEIVHSLDESLWKAARQSLSQKQRQEVIYKAECRAFHAQYLFQEELKTQYPELNNYYKRNFSSVPFLNRELSSAEISEMVKQSLIR
jgi:hypothetical protein